MNRIETIFFQEALNLSRGHLAISRFVYSLESLIRFELTDGCENLPFLFNPYFFLSDKEQEVFQFLL